jgi:hypothetical protein
MANNGSDGFDLFLTEAYTCDACDLDSLLERIEDELSGLDSVPGVLLNAKLVVTTRLASRMSPLKNGN